MRLIVRTHKSCRWCLIKETIVNRGTPNGQIFANTPEVPQMVFTMCQKPVWLIWSCPKNSLLFGCLRGTLVVTKVLGAFFVSSESVSYLYGSGRKSEDSKQPCFHQKLQGTFCRYTECFRRPFLTIIAISWY